MFTVVVALLLASPPTTPPQPTPAEVVEVTDGDTLDVSIDDRIEKVRLIGIDAAEAGTACGDAVTEFLAEVLPVGEPVLLTSGAVDDRDRYGRVLRYISFANPADDLAVEGDEMVDLGGYLLGGGLAIPTESDGMHPQEEAYHEIVASPILPECQPNVADHVAQGSTPATVPAPEPVAALEPQGNCHPSYTPCVPPPPPDLDCGDLSGPIQVSGDDPHRLDGDGDGVACE
jgi:micrococcal nuclease